ncbi:MAG: hypothetical protein Q9163_001040 [Psora crenata]
MSLTVRNLNGDTTFLLTFSPASQGNSAPLPPPQHHQAPGTFTILVDPWLSGATQILHPKFLLSRHTASPCIQDLSQISEPNVVIISQAKSDHCHESTLRQLDPTSPITTILAEPSAAKKVKSMKHFHPSMVHSLPLYVAKKPDSIVRFFIPPTTPEGTPGEATISFISAKIDLSGLHNAIGITYRPPSSTASPPRLNQRHATINPLLTPPDSPLPQSGSYNSSATPSSTRPSDSSWAPHDSNSLSSASTLSSPAPISHQSEKALSVIYSPHGLSYDPIHAYASKHLVQTAALPLTLLLHSFNRVTNPWWMGGNIIAGLPGGIEIAKNLLAKCWISVHDEDKDDTGVSVANVKKRKYSIEDVRSMVDNEGGLTNVLRLDVGAEVLLKA